MSSSGSEFARIVALLRNAQYRELELNVSHLVNLPIVEDAETMAPMAAQELELSGLTIEDLERLLETAAALVARFGVALNRGEAAIPDEEEWDASEGNQQPAQSRGIPLGLSVGFGLSYLIYVFILKEGDEARLLRYLKARRIPHAASFAKRLRVYYASVCAA